MCSEKNGTDGEKCGPQVTSDLTGPRTPLIIVFFRAAIGNRCPQGPSHDDPDNLDTALNNGMALALQKWKPSHTGVVDVMLILLILIVVQAVL